MNRRGRIPVPVVAILLVSFYAAIAQSAPAKWMGTWKLNREKSTFGPILVRSVPDGLTVVSATMKIEQSGGKIRISGDVVMSEKGSVSHDDNSLSLDGKETLVGPISLSFRRIDDSSFDVISRLNNGNNNVGEVSHFAFSSDGKTLTETKTQTIREVGPEGAVQSKGALTRTSVSILVFDKLP